MKKLYLAEICKIKRMKMTYVAYIGILFSMIISSVQLLGRVQDASKNTLFHEENALEETMHIKMK